jgi:hypothetical protein
MMTVEELIAKLKTFDPKTRVVTPGFDESNYDDVATVEEITLAIEPYGSGGHTGSHIATEDIEASKKYNDKPLADPLVVEKCVLIDF